MRRAYKFRLYPTESQSRDLGVMLESHRHLYNCCLGMKTLAYKGYRLSVAYKDQSSWFKTERRHNPWFGNLNFSSAQGTMRRLEGAFSRFFERVKANKVAKAKGLRRPFKKVGYPRFKGIDRFNSFLFPSHGDGCRLSCNRLRVQHVGRIKTRVHREVVGGIKTLSIKREAGKWFLILSCERPDPVVPKSDKPAVGIDMGLEHFLTTSDGEHVPNPRFHKVALPELRRANRRLARAKKGSRGRRKARHALQRVHARIANKRRDFSHKLSRGLVGRFGMIAAERLGVGNMLKNRRLSRSISDASWRAFLDATRYKAVEAGAEFVDVNPRMTSQTCSGCGSIVRKDLSVRWHDCPHCGLSLQRDVNAARNILALARNGPGDGAGGSSTRGSVTDDPLSLASPGHPGSPRL